MKRVYERGTRARFDNIIRAQFHTGINGSWGFWTWETIPIWEIYPKICIPKNGALCLISFLAYYSRNLLLMAIWIRIWPNKNAIDFSSAF